MHTAESSGGSIEHSIRANMLCPLLGNALSDCLRILPPEMLTGVEENLARLSREGIDEIRSVNSRTLPV